MRKVEVKSGWGLAFKIGQWGNGNATLFFCFIWPKIFIPLWFRLKVDTSTVFSDPWPDYGFHWDCSGFRGALFLDWGSWNEIIYMPWDWKHVRHDVLMQNGTWKRVKKGRGLASIGDDESSPWDWKDKYQEKHPYTYVRKNGHVQSVIATIGVEEMEWRWRWFTWLKWPNDTRRYIEVSFGDEIGERTGTWKGGCIGCSYDLLPNETPLDCLRRMEKERKFD